jgi:hypothetical protein
MQRMPPIQGDCRPAAALSKPANTGAAQAGVCRREQPPPPPPTPAQARPHGRKKPIQ